jgi:hypothetical protein
MSGWAGVEKLVFRVRRAAARGRRVSAFDVKRICRMPRALALRIPSKLVADRRSSDRVWRSGPAQAADPMVGVGWRERSLNLGMGE